MALPTQLGFLHQVWPGHRVEMVAQLEALTQWVWLWLAALSSEDWDRVELLVLEEDSGNQPCLFTESMSTV